MEEIPKSQKIVIALAIGLSILFIVILTSMVYMKFWTSARNSGTDPLEIEGFINSSNRSFEVIVFEDRIDWRDYKVRVDNLILLPNINVSNKGETLIFNNPDWNPLPNTTYQIKIVKDFEDLLCWEEFIKAT
jgi:hypothetical protein